MTTRYAASLAAALAFSATLSAPASAADGKGINGPELVAIIQDMGYRAKLDKDAEGDPMVETTMSGLNIQIYSYDCKDRRCGSLQVSVGLDMREGSTLKAMNEFSQGYRYAHVFLDEEMDPFMQYDFEVLHTNHAEHVKSQLELFENLLEDFTRISGFNDDAAPEDAAEAAAAEVEAAAEEAAADEAAQTGKPVSGKLDL